MDRAFWLACVTGAVAAAVVGCGKPADPAPTPPTVATAPAADPKPAADTKPTAIKVEPTTPPANRAETRPPIPPITVPTWR